MDSDDSSSAEVARTEELGEAGNRKTASDLAFHRWGGWGSNPRPKDYESSALTG